MPLDDRRKFFAPPTFYFQLQTATVFKHNFHSLKMSEEKNTTAAPQQHSVVPIMSGRSMRSAIHEFAAGAEAHLHDRDADILQSLGYEQEFKREFSLISTFGVAFSIIGILPSIATTLGYNMGYAGYVGMTWGWIAACFFIQFVGLSMAELCSALPTAGGLYYASAALAPDGWGPLCAWITGWANFIGQASFTPSVDWGLSSMILACASIGNPSYEPTTWQTFLLFILLITSHAAVSSLGTKFVAPLNIFSTVFNSVIIIIFCVLVPAASVFTPKTLGPHKPWTEFDNGTDFPQGIAFLMSFLTVIWTMCGYDAPFHLSEECSNANTACPLAIRLTVHIGGLLGFFVILVISYTVRDIDEVLSSPQPMAGFLQQVVGDKAALGMMSLIMIALWLVGQGVMVAASRVVYAYARDGAIPLSRVFKVVDKRTFTPVRAVWLLWLIALCYGCLGFNATAIGAVFSVGGIAQYSAFTIPVFLKLLAGKRFKPGPFSLGKFSIPANLLACAFVLVMNPILCFPAATGSDLTDINMNWTVVTFGGQMFLALAWYAIDARKWFKGPKVNVEHQVFAGSAPVESNSPVETDKTSTS